MTKTIAVLIGTIFVQIDRISGCAVADCRAAKIPRRLLARIERQSAGDLYST